MVKKLLHRCICVHARAHMHFLRRVCMHLDRCFGHHACAGVYTRRVLWTSAYTFANTLATGCAYALMHVQFVRSAVGGRGWRGSTNLWKHLLLGVGFIFNWRQDRGVVCVFSIFTVGGSVCGCMCVYKHTRTHTSQVGYWVVSPGVGIWFNWLLLMERVV